MNNTGVGPPRKLAIIGTRGIPAQHGGFETFAQQLGVRLVIDHGWEVTVIGDIDQKQKLKGLSEFRQVQVIYSKWSKRRQPMRFYLQSIRMAAKSGEVILVCGCGVALGGFLARWKGVPVFLNPDGLEWKRRKWSRLGRIALRILAFLSIRSSSALICDSLAIRAHLASGRLGRRAFVAEYGAELENYLSSCDFKDMLASLAPALKPYGYFLVVARLEPENNIDLILDAHKKSGTAMPLVIVGTLEDSKYVRNLRRKAGENVYFLGGVYDQKLLLAIRKWCRAYIHGHSVGGTNPSLLEAMAVANICICHDNEFNTETTAGHALFFIEVNKLAEILILLENDEEFAELQVLGDRSRSRICAFYSWDIITKRYINAIAAYCD